MRSSASPAASLTAGLRVFGGLCLLLSCPKAAAAQERKDLLEAEAAGAFQSFAHVTNLGGAGGGLLRIGLWLPLHFSIEGEWLVLLAETGTASAGVRVQAGSVSLLYNRPVGARGSAYLRGGIGSTEYGGACPAISIQGAGPCGRAPTLIGGLGFRMALSPVVMIRGEGTVSQDRARASKLFNYGGSLGLSLMLGSKPIPDSDGDGVLDNHDRCPGTPAGARVDRYGCPVDSDGDGIPDGIDRCPGTPLGAVVDATGCPIDSDGDGVPDGLDKCPDTPHGALVDPNGCPKDSDGDGIPDGLDHCPYTPRGAAVDAVGCPGDEDGDGVLDGLDRCPHTPPGTPVDSVGCPVSQQRRPESE